MSNLKVTDIPTVTRLFPPTPAGGNNEMKIQEQANLVKEAFDEYKAGQCDDKGNIKKNNLSKRQMKGKSKVRRRVLNKEIVIATTDKSKKYVITTPEIYKHAASKHIGKDVEVDWQDVKPTEVLLNRHCLHLAAALEMGKNHDEVDRVNSALKSSDNQPPPVYFMFKDHKETKDGEPCPDTRPVCAAKEGILARLSHLVSQVLTPVADKLNEEVGSECYNTEEMKRGLHDTNVGWKTDMRSQLTTRIWSPYLWMLKPCIHPWIGRRLSRLLESL